MRLSHHAGVSNVGRVRKNNEDVYAISLERNLALVADGMGGAACGEIASAMTAEAVREYFDSAQTQPPAKIVEGSIHFANDRVWQAAQAPGGCDGMGTTLVLAHWEQDQLWLANVGDSRGYILRQGALQQLTYDQNLANDLRETLQLTDEQIASYPQRNALTMAMGTRAEVQFRMCQGALQDGDTLLLCTDGLTNPLKDEAIRSILLDIGPLETAAETLVEAAMDNGGTDNVTVVLLRFSFDRS